jgi:hypothetical protein
MKKVLYILIVLGVASFGFAITFQPYEHINLFQGAFSTGIGKATTAVKGLGTESFLANPANGGEKFSFDIISINPFQFNNTTLQLLRDLQEMRQTRDFTKLFDYIGTPVNVRLGVNLIGFNIPIYDFSLNFGIFATVYAYLEVHNPLSTAGLIDLLGFSAASFFIGTSYSFKHLDFGNPEVNKYLSNLSVGLNMKLVLTGAVNRKLTLADFLQGSDHLNQILNEELSKLVTITNIKDLLVKPDIGLSYELPIDEMQKVNFGLSILNIGGIPIGDFYIPTTVNLGAAYSYDLSTLIGNRMLLKNTSVSLDFHDIFFQRKDKDFFKRLHIGLKTDLANLNDIIVVSLGLGISQGYPTFGVGFKLATFKINYSISAEELGVYAGQDPDVRQNISISIGW